MKEKGAKELYFSTYMLNYDTNDNKFKNAASYSDQALKYYNNIDGGNEILISNKVTLDELENAKGPITLKFKRLNGIIRLNFKPGDGVTWDDISGMKMLVLNTFNKENNFGGSFTVDFTKGEMSPYEYFDITLMLDDIFEDELKDTDRAVCFPKENIPAYVTSLPITIKKDESFKFLTRAKSGVIRKEIIPKEDVVIEPGKITTFNVTINKADLPQ